MAGRANQMQIARYLASLSSITKSICLVVRNLYRVGKLNGLVLRIGAVHTRAVAALILVLFSIGFVARNGHVV